MTQSREESPPSRIELIVLACLSQSKPPTDAELGEVVQQLALPGEPDDAVRRRAIELRAGLVRRGWVTGDDESARRAKPRRNPPPWRLTESGKRVLRNEFNLHRAPTWAQVRDKHVPSLALGLAPGSEVASSACTESALTAAVLCTRFGIRDAHSPVAVCDALIADALGMSGGKLTLDRIRAHVLARGIDKQAKDAPSPETKGYGTKLATWIACSAVGAVGAGEPKRRMARAIARRWVCGDAHPLGVCLDLLTAGKSTTPVPAHVDVGPRPGGPLTPDTGGKPAPQPRADRDVGRDVGRGSAVAAGGPGTGGTSPPAVKLPNTGTSPNVGKSLPPAAELLQVVREAIPRVGAEGRFGEKVYVSAIWRSIARDHKAGDLSLDHFKRWLLSANRDGWLVLARADLIGAMDPKQVTESEIHDRGATFHFVLDQRNGAAASSQRESHAG